MPRGSTRSQLSLQQRKELANQRFTQGFTNSQIAEELGVDPTTVGQYRRQYEEQIAGEAATNPQLLRDVLANTIRALAELDVVRQSAWDEYNRSIAAHHIRCPECDHQFTEVSGAGAQTRNQLLNTVTKAQEQRGKLLGLFGVKQEFFLHVQNVRIVQEHLLAFMAQHLCAEDKAKLETLLTGELAPMIGAAAGMPILEAEIVE